MTPLTNALILISIFIIFMGLILWYAMKESRKMKGGKKK